MAENNSYTPENDLNPDASLTQDDIYTPENDLDLDQSLLSVPILATTTATAQATGETASITGVSTLETVEADSLASGQTINLTGSTTLDITGSTATGIGGQANLITGNFTTDSALAAATGGSTNLQDTGLETAGATSTAAGGTGLTLEIPPRPTTGATAEATGGETQFDVLGNGGEVTVLIDGERIDSYTNIEIQKRLNEVDTFSFEAFITEDQDRALISEGNTVKFLENYDTLLFKGRLTEVEYQSGFRAKCEGDGMVTKLLNRKTNRDTYTNRAGDDIIKAEVDQTTISYGTIETAPQVSVRFDHDNEARAVAGVANATGYDWYIDQDPADDWDTDRLNFVKDAGRSTTQADLTIGENAQFIERNKDEGFVANDITLLGRGDGINQLEANVFAASTAFTDTTQIIDENETNSFTVEDTSQLGATGDDLIVRVGIETMDVTISDSTTLSINSRAVNDYAGNETEQIQHYEGVRVWRLENQTQGIGRFTPENKDSAEDGSSIETKGVKEQRETDKTIVDLSTLEKVADLELKNRFEDVFRVKVQPTEPRITEDLRLGDQVKVQDLTAMDVDNTFDVVGIDIMRSSAEEGTELHLANRPRRLTERLSEIESDRDTLNAHMQGATNFNGEHFEDNVDNTHPLNNKVFVPDDVVKINKFELTFARESFRGYTESTEAESSHTHGFEVTHPSHSHDVDIDIPDHDHDVSISIPDHDHEIDLTNSFLQLTDIEGASIDAYTLAPVGDSFNNANLGITGGPDVIQTDFIVEGSAGSDHTHAWPQDTADGEGDIEIDLLDITGKMRWPDVDDFGSIPGNPGFIANIYADTNENNVVSEDGGGEFISTTTDNGGSEFITETSETALGATESTTTEAGSAHSHGVNYGIFEPTTEPDIDVEVYVDGNLVTTVNNVGVGDEITSPINLKNDLADPLTGTYHDIELKPIDTGGGNNGRSRLAADVTEKVFIESTL